MKNTTQNIATKVANLLKQEGITSYDQTKNIFSQVRKTMQLSPPEQRKKRASAETMSTEEVRHFLTTASQNDPTVGLMMETLYRTALRARELVSLRTEDLEPGTNMLRVTNGKGEQRPVTITSSLARQLMAHLAGQTQPTIFTSNRNKPFSPRRIEQLITETAKQAGLSRKITPGTLRKARIEHLRAAGMSDEDLVDFIR